jgi:NAD(P)-dependent dehydrogenase (short-subunit alcohol dehydrogenase family)
MHIFKDSLAGKVALVTGAGSGIGRATARLLALSGARVGLLGRTRDELEKTRNHISQENGESLILVADVTSASALDNAVETIDQKWGRLDIVVANAGINGLWAALEDISASDWDRTLQVNLRGTFLTVKSTTPLLKRRGGAVVVVSSINGTRVFSHTGATAYSTSKAGQVAMARMLALELAPHGVRLNTVCPGEIATEIEDNTERRNLEEIGVKAVFPEGKIPLTHDRPGEPEQVARLIWFLASDAANHITGTEVFIDGGESLLEG